ncbi:MAG: UvrD-helicase domain-containing protein [Prevotella sp.]|nr:UvrD-helicase domain-containing protein [Prevotella sp.]
MEQRKFNTEQQEVIETLGGRHLVLAPPGCGKTAVLAERIVWAHEHGVELRDMACLTFTNRASRGMRDRIYERLGNRAAGLDELFIGNVHRFCSRFLFEQGVVPEHTAIIDTDTSISILADYLADDELRVLGDTKWRQHYSQIINLQHLMYQCVHHYPADLIVHRDALRPAVLRELCLAFGLPYTQEAASSLYQHAGSYRDDPAVLLSAEARQQLDMLYAARQYEQYKLQNDLLDFEDLLLKVYDTAVSQPAAKIRWLQIDEVQDLNPLQLVIIDLFTADDATVVYLGDAQQAIFSFMGAKTDTLAMLRERCGAANVHNFYRNYRSPRYLLDVFNAYGEHQLGISPDLLPSTTDLTPQQPGDLQLLESDTSIDEANRVARLVEDFTALHPDETTAVVVAFNSDADDVSAALGQLPHFKISGTDFFATAPMRLLLAHLQVVAMENNFIAWSQLFSGLKLYSSNSSSRQMVRAMMQVGVTPVDFLDYDGSTYVAEFVRAYETGDIVIFDTETTGLNVFEDDVVQIAAVKIRQGRVTDRLNLFIETNRELPPMLGDVVNPLIAEYACHPHVGPDEAFCRFFDFAEGCALLGHNATYDYQIMLNNIRRRAAAYVGEHRLTRPFDTLKLARLLRPRLKSYKLRDLLDELHLEGENSHLADDDVVATRSLAICCYDMGRSVVGRQLEFVSRHRKVIERFRYLYADLYHHARNRLYEPTEEPAIARELTYAYHYLLDIHRLPDLPKLSYLIRYIETDLFEHRPADSLADQLRRYMPDLATLKEADLCGSQSMQERVFVSTVHKAKGLEFDNVIVYDAVDGKFPSVYADNDAAAQEEARKFYVAISRARRRLVIISCQWGISRWGRRFQRQLSPYMNHLRTFFK